MWYQKIGDLVIPFLSLCMLTGAANDYYLAYSNKSKGKFRTEKIPVGDTDTINGVPTRSSKSVHRQSNRYPEKHRYGRTGHQYDVRESRYLNGGIPTSCCVEVSRYLAVLAAEERKQRDQTHQYHVHLSGLVQTAREALAQMERSASQVSELRQVVNELREEINRTRKQTSDSGGRGDPCTAEARQRPTLVRDMPERHEVVHLCAPMPISNPSFEVRDRSWIPYSKGYDYWTGNAPDGRTAIKVYNGGARQTLRFPPGTISFVIGAFSKSTGVPGKESNNYSLKCDVQFSDKRWRFGESMYFVPNSDWHERRLKIKSSPKKTIANAWCYVLFTHFPGGTAYFDNVRVWLTGLETDASKCG